MFKLMLPKWALVKVDDKQLVHLGNGEFFAADTKSLPTLIEGLRPNGEAGAVATGVEHYKVEVVDSVYPKGSERDIMLADIGDQLGRDLVAKYPKIWGAKADEISVGAAVIRIGDKITDGTRTEIVKTIICGSTFDSPAIFFEPHSDGTRSSVLSVDQIVDGGWRKVEADPADAS